MSKWKSFGGVIFNPAGEVLLRRPANNFGNTAWTFAKGMQDDGLSAEATALKEVLEETGYRCRIVAELPGEFPGTHSVTRYFLMVPEGEPEPFDPAETEALVWVSPDKAPEYIQQTGSTTTRGRDLQVLEVAVAAWRKLPSAS